MRLRTILLVIVLLLLAIPVVGAIALWSVDESYYRRLIAEQVERTTGRKLTIEGGIGVALALRPTLAVERVALANAPWAEPPAMLRLDRLEVQFDALSLLGDRPEIDRIVLIAPEIELATDAEGRGNWEFQSAAASPPGAPAPAGPPPVTEPEDDGLPLIRQVVIERGHLRYRDAAGGETVVQLARAELRGTAPEAPVQLDLAGSLDGVPLALQGQVGPVAAIVAGRPFTVDLAARLAGIDARVLGEIADAAALAVDLALEAQAADLGGLAAHLPDAGEAIRRLGPLDARLRLVGDRQALNFRDLSARLAESDLAGGGTLRLDGARPRLDAALTAKRLDLRPLLDGMDGGAPNGSGGTGGGGPARPEGEQPLFSREPLPIDNLRALDANLQLGVERLETPKLALDAVQAKALLENGRLRLEPFGFAFAGRPVRGRLAFAAPASTLDLELAAEALDIGRLLAVLDLTTLLEGQGDLRARLAAKGESPHALAATLKGQVSLLMGGGRLRLEALSGQARELARLLAAPAAEAAALRCLALDAPIEAGVARPNLVLDAGRALVIGKGTVDLGREIVDLVLSPKVEVQRLNVSVSVRVHGPLQAPGIGLDEQGAVRRLAGLLGGDIFPPAVRDALRDLGGGGENLCLTPAAAKEERPARREAVPGLPAELPKSRDEAKEALERAGKGLLQDLLRSR